MGRETVVAAEVVVTRGQQGMSLKRLLHGEKGGSALLFLIAFMAMAVPIATESLRATTQLSQNSRVYEAKLSGDLLIGHASRQHLSHSAFIWLQY